MIKTEFIVGITGLARQEHIRPLLAVAEAVAREGTRVGIYIL